jgi:hypothetical protein
MWAASIGTTNWTTGDLVFECQQGKVIFTFSAASSQNLGLPKPPVQGIWGPHFQRVKWLGIKTDPSPPSNAQVKNNSTSHYSFMAWGIWPHSWRTKYSISFRLVVSVVVTVMLMCLTALPLFMFIMGEMPFVCLHASMKSAVCCMSLYVCLIFMIFVMCWPLV